ncbi:hypothetical protein [Actinocrispum wychmicini]|uniref:Peptidase inhibitor family I36 n=1 Tax=Actinocrispum wychmicini TaxID=1213861 RepID=A0A4V2S7B9_9PSEU|nr:hypothetical protein [Actinocrispum wychmicini]TCO59310.1 hypothetical protein EV192_104151 [Actinocrispum wychmicini]
MRARHLTAVVAAVALAVGIPASANATTGDFLYKAGPLPGVLTGLADPESGVCIDLPDIGDHPGYAPENLTTSTATVFLDAGCEGDVFRVMNPGKRLGDRLKLRSVVFS